MPRGNKTFTSKPGDTPGFFLSGAAAVLLGITLVHFVVWAFTGQGPLRPNDYNSYALQAEAWLNGRLDLGRFYGHLELAVYQGKYYVSFPPFPSFALLPFALFFGAATPDHGAALFSSWAGALYALRLARSLGVRDAEFWVLFLFTGGNILVVSVNGWVWFIAQNMAFTLSLAALYYAEKGRGGLSLACLACAVGCRPFQLVYAPLLLYILLEKEKARAGVRFRPALSFLIRKRFYWVLPPLCIAAVYMALNYLRFGNVLEFGHNYLPEFTESPHGQFSPVYIRENLRRLFRLPMPGAGGGLSFPWFDGMAFWLASPIFISFAFYAAADLYQRAVMKLQRERSQSSAPFAQPALPLRTVRQEPPVRLGPAAVIAALAAFHFFLFCLHKTLGGWHFGNRYTVDALPFIFYGLLRMTGGGNERWTRFQYPLFLFGLALNTAGALRMYGG